MTSSRIQGDPRDDRSLQDVYLALATDWSVWYGELDEALRRVAQTLTAELAVQRASIWLMQDDRGCMRCQLLYDALEERFGEGTELPYAETPAFFEALRSGRLVDAHDAWTDPRTRELAGPYLRDAGIGALMDATLRLAGETAGVLSLEHVGGPRLWTEAERRFVVSMADLVSQLLVQDRTRRNEGRYRALLDNMPSAAFRCVFETVWTVQFISGGASTIYGLPESSLRGARRSGLHAHVHADDLVVLESALAAARAAMTTIDLEYRVNRPDGELRWVHEQGQASVERATGAMVLDGVITDVTDRRRADDASRRQRDLLVHIAEGTAGATGDKFFDTLTRELARVLEVDYVLVGEAIYGAEPCMQTISYFAHGSHAANFVYGLAGTPCEQVLRTDVCAYPSDVKAHFPADGILARLAAESYLGVPLISAGGESIGALIAIHTAPIPDIPFAETLLRIFAARAAAELDGRRREIALQESRAELLARNEVLQMVNTLSSRLQSSSGPESIARETVDVLVGFRDPPVVAFFLLEPDGVRLRLAAQAGMSEPAQRLVHSLPFDSSLAGLALRGRRVLFSDDALEDDRVLQPLRELLQTRASLAMVALPLAHGELALGAIVVAYRPDQAIVNPGRDAFESIATTVSLALANTRHVASLEHQAYHDALTGLPNRARLHLEFERLASGKAIGAIVPSLLLLDLNRFKEINDSLGHHVGDLLLCRIGPRIAEALLTEPSLVCRLGGDEFAVLLFAGGGTFKALECADRVLAALRQPFDVDGMRLEIGASIGAAVYPEHGGDSHQLLRSADVAMYEAKRSGAGVVAYDPSFDEHTPERLAIIQELGDAIRERQLILHFQPKVNLASGAVVGFEALVRWQHPRLGLLGPGAFIPLAEVGDLMQGVTRNVIELALAQLRQWGDAGLPYTMAINLSPRNLLERDFVANFEHALVRSGADPKRVELELTETALMQDPEGAAKRLERIVELGVRISIDDFGTGYSSLAHLRRLPIHALKIDQLFVTEMATNAQDLAIVRSTIGLGRNLGLEVVAEGVETAQVMEMLGELDCDIAQGYVLSPPKPWPAISEWLAGDAKKWLKHEPR